MDMKKNNRIWIYSLVVIGAFLMLATSCKKDGDNNDSSLTGSVKDIDGNVYHTVTIGTQVWMVENLKTTKYQNGDPIPNVTDNSQWTNLETGAFCNYNNDAAIGAKYGKLYNYYAVYDSRNIAPTGWHVAASSEWKTLEDFVAANLGNSGSVAKALASKTDWASSTKEGAIGNDFSKNNFSGFTALPAGVRQKDGEFGGEDYYRVKLGIGFYSSWWNSTPGWTVNRDMFYDESTIDSYSSEANYPYFIYYGFSVRCVKD
jgi:uncharacterized protein (TIGR02145 family)